MAQIKITHPSILVERDLDYAEMDIFEGESKIYPGISHTSGKVIDAKWNTLGWYDYKVDTDHIYTALYTDPDTFERTLEACYVIERKYKKFGSTEWNKDDYIIPTYMWDVPAAPKAGIDDIKFHLEALMMLWAFEPNDDKSRESICAAVERDLDVFKAQQDIVDYVVICDETNNTPDSIDRNQMKVDVAIRTTDDYEWIFLPIMLTPVVDMDIETNEDAYNRAMGII